MPEEIKKTTKLKKLVKLAHNNASFFKDPDSRAYAKIEKGEHREELYPLKSSSFEDWLSAINFNAFEEVATSKLKSDTTEFLEGQTRFSGKTHEVGFRVMGSEEYIEIDLGDKDWQSIYITRYNWRVGKHKNNFYRNKSMKSLPVPSRDKLDKDWAGNIFNISGNSQSMLIMGWLIGCFMPEAPKPMLVIQGEQGSGKSFLASMLKSLIDPAKADKTSLPSSERDLYVQAQNNYVLSFDNQRTLHRRHSDWLCRMVTGGGYSTRRLYTNNEEEVFSATRPIILNGITQIADQPDLIDRSIFINTTVIDNITRKPEKELLKSINSLKPMILGKICSALSASLGNKKKEHAPLPRMADFAKFVSKAEEELGWEDGSLVDAMNANRRIALEEMNEYDPLLSLIQELGRKNKNLAFIFSGTPVQLFEMLIEMIPGKFQKSAFPESPATLSKRLNGLKPVLRVMGIEIKDIKSNGKRIKRIEWAGN
jgi:energy-coupling factor transporter ATP-binding protein EcfA2